MESSLLIRLSLRHHSFTLVVFYALTVPLGMDFMAIGKFSRYVGLEPLFFFSVQKNWVCYVCCEAASRRTIFE